MSDTLETLLAKQAITEQLYNYCRAFDRLDRELALSVWHVDGTVQYGNKPAEPISAYLGPSEEYRRSLSNCSHQITNLLIRVRGERAVSEAYVTASLQEQPQEGRMVENLFRGRYIDRWSRRNAVWAIDHRRFIPDSYTRIETPAFPMPEFFTGHRDRRDPSYIAWNELDAEA